MGKRQESPDQPATSGPGHQEAAVPALPTESVGLVRRPGWERGKGQVTVGGNTENSVVRIAGDSLLTCSNMMSLEKFLGL